MALTRKRAKELKRLKSAAYDLWDDQKDLFEHASGVVREASRQAANAGREEVVPRLRDALDHNVRPALNSGLSAGRSAAETARKRWQREVLPNVSSRLAGALAVLEVSKDPRVMDAVARVREAGSNVGHAVGVRVTHTPPKKAAGAGTYIVVVLAVVGLAGVAYAAWQTLRADDELWVSDDDADASLSASDTAR